MISFSRCPSVPQVCSFVKESLFSPFHRDKRVAAIASIAFGLVALATKRVMIAVPIALGLSAAYYIFERYFSKNVDLRPPLTVPVDLRPKIVPQPDRDVRQLTEELTAADLPMYAGVRLTTHQMASLNINGKGISGHDHFIDSYFSSTNIQYSKWNGNAREDCSDWWVTRVPRIHKRNLPEFTPVYLSNVQVSVLNIDNEGISNQDGFEDSYFICVSLRNGNADNPCSDWMVTRVPFSCLQAKDFPKFTSVTLSNDQYLSLQIDSAGKSSRTCFRNFKFNCKRLPSGDWVVSRDQ